MRRLLIAGLLISVAPVGAQGGPRPDPMSHLVPPEIIMQHQQELALTEEQRDRIKRTVAEAQAVFTELQWDLQAEMEKLGAAVSDRGLPQGQVLERLDAVLAAEAEVKRNQLSMLLSLREILEPEQYERALRRVRRSRRPAQRAYPPRSRNDPSRSGTAPLGPGNHSGR